jgi:hypothetical protein
MIGVLLLWAEGIEARQGELAKVQGEPNRRGSRARLTAEGLTSCSETERGEGSRCGRSVGGVALRPTEPLELLLAAGRTRVMRFQVESFELMMAA